MTVPIYCSAVRLAELIRSREVTSLEVLDSYLSRIASVNPTINAFAYYDAEGARAQAREIDRLLRVGERLGPLAGIPMTVKDLYEVQGMPSASGTTGRATYRPRQDATAVARLRRAGAVVIGKTSVPEFGLALETTNLVTGTTKNPYDLERTPGGSSGGAAAALAAGFSALEIGSDGGGSIRIPAHFCGVAGFKPTSYRVSKAGHFPEHTGTAKRMGGHGPLARTVADLRLAFELLLGEDVRDPDALPAMPDPESAVATRSLRVAYYTDNGIRPATAETVAMVEGCARILADMGATVTAAPLPMLAEAFEIHLGLLIVDRCLIREWQALAGTQQLHPWVQSGLEYLEKAGAEFDSNTATLLSHDWETFRKEATRFMHDFDILLSPVAPGPALRHGEITSGENFDWTSYACVHNVTGWPAATVRCGTSSEGLPLGIQVAGKAFRDRLVLDVAEVLERVAGGFVPPPNEPSASTGE